MDFFQAIITGVIQGLTEFLPVSSSGHIVLTSSIYKLLTGQDFSTGSGEEIFFDIMLHVGTLVAVLIFFRKDIVHLMNTFFKAVKEKNLKDNQEALIPVYIAIGTIATVGVVLPFKDQLEAFVYRPDIVGLVLIGTGTILFSTEHISDRFSSKVKDMSWKKSIFIGLAQGLAVMPGLSRSGATIAAGLATGLDRVTCARYSFLLSIPIIIAAALFHALEMTGISQMSTYNWGAILSGTVVSGVVGYYCIKYFIDFISKHKLNIFAIYCCIIGISMYIFFGYIVN